MQRCCQHRIHPLLLKQACIRALSRSEFTFTSTLAMHEWRLMGPVFTVRAKERQVGTAIRQSTAGEASGVRRERHLVSPISRIHQPSVTCSRLRSYCWCTTQQESIGSFQRAGMFGAGGSERSLRSGTSSRISLVWLPTGSRFARSLLLILCHVREP